MISLGKLGDMWQGQIKYITRGKVDLMMLFGETTEDKECEVAPAISVENFT